MHANIEMSQSTEELFHGNSSYFFAQKLLPFYGGPSVTIHIGNASHAYTVSKALLCKQSAYFTKLFNGSFRGQQEQLATLQIIDDVVTVRSVELTLQWLHTGDFCFDTEEAEEEIGALIEFSRIADMLEISGMESRIAETMKSTLKANLPPWNERGVDDNTYKLTSHHVNTAINLPDEHPVRSIIADAAARGFIESDQHKFAKEARETPFGNDLLMSVQRTLKNAVVGDYVAKVSDPLTGKLLRLSR